MKILEVREGFIKFESKKQVSLSSFIQVDGNEKCYIAQVVQVKRSGEAQIAYAKILFLYDGTLQPYDKTLPNKDSEIVEFTFDIINKSLDSTQPVIVGKFIDNDLNIPIDKTYFNKKLLISSDSPQSLTTIISNIEKQLSTSSNVVIIDMLGNLGYSKQVAGQDFKLPLNTESLSFMYEDCLNDATSDSKAMIKEIFQDLSEYSKSVPFLPFAALKSIIDDMVDKSHIFKLLVLKNKLAKFDKQGYFAANENEAKNLEKILTQRVSAIDLSKLDTIFQNRYLEVICSVLEKQAGATQIFINMSNAISKKSLKNIMTNENLASVFVTHSKFKYINEIKTMFDNFIIEPSFANNEIFKVYATFLNSMQKNTALIVGEGTNYIPLVADIKPFVIESAPEVKIEKPNSDQESQVENKPEEDDKIVEITLTDQDENIPTEVELPETLPEEISAIETIDKKSEELIERVSEEVEAEKNTFSNIFTSEDEIEEEFEDNVQIDSQNRINDENIVENSKDVELESARNTENKVAIEEEPTQELEVIDLEQTENKYTVENQEPVEIPETVEMPGTVEMQEQLEETELEEVSTEENEAIIVEVLEEEPFEELNESEEIDISNDEIVEETTLEEELQPESLSSNDMLEENFDLNQEEESEIIEISDEISIMTESIESDNNEIEDNGANFPQDFGADVPEERLETSYDEPELEVLPITEDNDSLDEFGEIIELDDSELQEGDIIVDLEDENLSEEEILDKEIVEDVDKVFTTMKEDSISDSDLDFIDELNEEIDSDESLNLEDLDSSDNNDTSIEELPEYNQEEDSGDMFLEPLQEINENQKPQQEDKEILETRKSSTPIVPVYDAEIPQEDIVTSDLIEQGDSVNHAKYGHGVVEKMIKYGTKTLYSINFENIGRRLLDPTLTEIKKL